VKLKRKEADAIEVAYWRVAGAFILLVLLGSMGSASDPGTSPDERGPGGTSAALAVSVSETPDAILLRIQASGDVEPGSVEVRFAGHKTVVLARDAEGRAIRSQPFRLPEPVTEEGSSADYDADGALVMTLRKQATAYGAGPTDDPEAAAR
jgi:HSP20 family molecular chaperone IbpA